MKFYTLLLSSILFMVLFTGCSSRQVAAQNSGFFKDYTNLKTSKNIDVYKYKEILVSNVVVISSIPEKKQTESQKKLYKEISEYVTAEYKKIFADSTMYKLVEKESDSTIRLESAISAVEVHFDDATWNNNTPVALGIDVVSFNSYLEGYVRILGESRLVDAWSKEVLGRHMDIQKDMVIALEGDTLQFSDVKDALDSWISSFKTYINN